MVECRVAVRSSQNVEAERLRVEANGLLSHKRDVGARSTLVPIQMIISGGTDILVMLCSMIDERQALTTMFRDWIL